MTISFDELFRKAREVAVTAGKVASDMVGEVVDTSKAKIAEAKLSGEIREVTERLGSIVYEAAKTGRDSIKLQEMLIGELDNLYKAQEELRKKTAAAVGVVLVETVCPECGERNAATAVFCSKCGCRMISEQPAEYAVETEIGVEPEDVEQYITEPEVTEPEVTEPQIDEDETSVDA